ncbi:hypothetical protein ACSNOI_08780 [Actinomadura kijaniata]|uniref:hypothetical protein n=1 Tax=Actinomadura kijaniata TaxID=46161 RepID=UPI003F19D79B
MKAAYSSLSMALGAGAWIRCSTYPDSTPILSISLEDTSLSVSFRPDRTVSADHVAMARQLAKAAQTFAAEVERLHNEHMAQIQHLAKTAVPSPERAV